MGRVRQGGIVTDEMPLAWRNRRLIAERTGWPDGALETCERLDEDHQGWSVMWVAENPGVGREHPAGFSATRSGWRLLGGDDLWGDNHRRAVLVFAPTVPELEERIDHMTARWAKEGRGW
ncbi:hypothetical protein [Actinoplanes sp. NPDC051851]|uniref:hypothetical protein n=1 Tax=Actinoplanes sp. NPDC051851 TaxID=3154753 RepID=UPI00343B2143